MDMTVPNAITPESLAESVTFRQIIDAYKVAKGGNIGFDPHRVEAPKKINLLTAMFKDNAEGKCPQFSKAMQMLGEAAECTVYVPPTVTVSFDEAATLPPSTLTGESMQAQPQTKLSQDALAALGSTLAAALGGFDETKVRETVRQETSQAVNAARAALDKAKADAEFVAKQAESVRIDVNKAKQDVTTMATELQVKAETWVKDAIANSTPRTIQVVRDDGKAVNVGQQHKTFPTLLKLVSTGVNVWLPGPAGSGKSTAAHKVAESLSLPFYHQGKVMADFQVLGFIDAGGTYHATEFRKAYETGGVFLADECDAWAADATLVLNMAIENGAMAFPDKTVPRHKDFLLIAAANTFGAGATADYVGRNKLDGAFLDRFVTLEWNYDEGFETMLSGNAAWAGRVQAWRSRAKAKGIKVIISPRASIVGAKLLAAGFPEKEVIDMVVRKGMVQEQWNAIQQA